MSSPRDMFLKARAEIEGRPDEPYCAGCELFQGQLVDAEHAIHELQSNPDNAYFHGENAGWQHEREAVVRYIRERPMSRGNKLAQALAREIENAKHVKGRL